MLSSETMVNRTSGGLGCNEPGDYLSWNEMEWNIHGDVVEGNVTVGELCKTSLVPRVFFNTFENQWSRCLRRCENYQGSQMISFQSDEELQQLILEWLWPTTLDLNTPGVFWEDIRSTAFWVPYRYLR